MKIEATSPPAVRMSWANLAFLHWRLDPALLRPLIPAHFDLDLFDHAAWVGLVPFKMVDCRFRGFALVPTLREFYECNVRTYVRHQGLPGVWFFSLDAQNLLPVIGGRAMWNLNYVYSRFRVTPHAQGHDYALSRHPGPWPKARTHIRWTLEAALPTSRPGSLEHFLTERYELFTVRGGRVFAGRVHHAPWTLHAARIDHLDDTLIAAAGLRVEGPPAIVMASPRIDVTGDPLRPLPGQSPGQ